MRQSWLRRVAAILLPALLIVSAGPNPGAFKDRVYAASEPAQQAPAVTMAWNEWAALHQAVADLTDEVLGLTRVVGDPGGLLGIQQSFTRHRSAITSELAKVQADLSRVEADLRGNSAPAVVLTRQREAGQALVARVQKVIGDLDAVRHADSMESTAARLHELANSLQAWNAPAVPIPSTLPFGPPASTAVVSQLPAALGIPGPIVLPLSVGAPGEDELAVDHRPAPFEEEEGAWSDVPPVADPLEEILAQVGNRPGDIAGWVHRSIDSQWYAGHAKEPSVTLSERAGNDTDAAVLLVTLLRLAGHPARYATGTVALDQSEWTALTGLSNGAQAARLFAAAGLPTSAVTTGEGTVTRILVPHTWVEFWNAETSRWMAVDVSWKGLTVQKDGPGPWVPRFDLHQYLIRNGDRSPLEMWESQLRQSAQAGGQSVPYVFTDPEPTTPAGSLPSVAYTVVGDAQAQATIPASQQASVSVDLPGLAVALPFSAVSGHRVTLTYAAFDEADQEVMAAFGGMEQTPPYLLRLKPVVKLDGETVAEGSVGVLPGTIQALTMHLRLGQLEETLVRPVYAGSWYTLLVTPHSVGKEGAEQHETDALARPVTSFDDLMGDQLLGAAYKYVGDVDAAADRTARLMDLAVADGPRVAVAGFAWQAYSVLGVPYAHGLGGRSFDAARVMGTPVDPRGSESRAIDYWQVVGAEAGYRESQVFSPVRPEVKPVTTLGRLSEAVSVGENLHWVCRADGDVALPDLDVSHRTYEQLQAVFQQDKLLVTPTSGRGGAEAFIVIDPATGASGYFLEDGSNGLRDSLASWYGDVSDKISDQVDRIRNLKWWEPLAYLIEKEWMFSVASMAGMSDEQRHAIAGGLAVGIIDGAWAGLKGEWDGIRELPEIPQRVFAAMRWIDRWNRDIAFRVEVAIEIQAFGAKLQDLWTRRAEVIDSLVDAFGEHVATRSGWSRSHPQFAYWALSYVPGYVAGFLAELVGVAYLTASVSAIIKAATLARLPKLLAFLSRAGNVTLVRVGIRALGKAPEVLDLVKSKKLQAYFERMLLSNIDELEKGSVHTSRMLIDAAEAFKAVPSRSSAYRIAEQAWREAGLTPADAEVLRMVRPKDLDPELRQVQRRMRSLLDETDPIVPGEMLRKTLTPVQARDYLTGQRKPANQFAGFFARAKHTDDAVSPDDFVEFQRLDYGGRTGMEKPAKEIFWVEFPYQQGSHDFEVPFAPELGGTMNMEENVWPFTGTGWTSSRNGRWVAEYRFKKPFTVSTTTIMWRMDERGVVRPYAELGESGWTLIKGGMQELE